MILTNRDNELLRALVEIFRTGPDERAVAQLEAELDRATVVPGERLPPDIVTMNSRVVFEDQTGRRREIVLVYPPAADPTRGRISVLEPLGTALLGLAVGEALDGPDDEGRPARLRIVSVLYQTIPHGSPGRVLTLAGAENGREETGTFNHLSMQQQAREAVAEGARLRARAALWESVSIALAIVGVLFAATAVHGGHVEGAVALVAFAAATLPAVWSYLAWRGVARADQRILGIVSTSAEQAAVARIRARDGERAFDSSPHAPAPSRGSDG